MIDGAHSVCYSECGSGCSRFRHTEEKEPGFRFLLQVFDLQLSEQTIPFKKKEKEGKEK